MKKKSLTKKAPYKSLKDIPQFICWSSYIIDVSWSFIEEQLEYYEENYGLDLDPDFQRGHVWTKAQQVAYVEHCLQGGKSTILLHWNCYDWNEHTGLHPIVLIDGKQRLTAVRAFLSNDLSAFGKKRSEYSDKLGIFSPVFKFHVNELKTRAAVLQWYLELNAGGVVHSNEELEKVRQLLEKEKKKK